jgi:hypothetical protein
MISLKCPVTYSARKCPNILLKCLLTPCNNTTIITVSPNANSQQPCHILCKTCKSYNIHIRDIMDINKNYHHTASAMDIPVNSTEHLHYTDPSNSQQKRVVRNRIRNKWSMKTIIIQMTQSRYLKVLFSTLQNVSLVTPYATQDSMYQAVYDILVFVNCNWVDSHWQ